MRVQLEALAFVEGTVCRIRVASEVDLLAQLNRRGLLCALVAVLPAQPLAPVLLVRSQLLLRESEVQDVGVTVQCAQDVPW